MVTYWQTIMCFGIQAAPELNQIWAVGQKMWQRDFPGIYETLQKEWSEPYKEILAAALGLWFIP